MNQVSGSLEDLIRQHVAQVRVPSIADPASLARLREQIDAVQYEMEKPREFELLTREVKAYVEDKAARTTRT